METPLSPDSSSINDSKSRSLATKILNKLPSINVSTPSLLSSSNNNSSASNSNNNSSSSLSAPTLDPEMFEFEASSNPDDYDILHPIGFGSSAVVYAAIYKPANRMVAIKMLDLDMFERDQIEEIRKELQIMTLCKHKNLLPVNGAFVHQAKLYIITPYLASGSCLNILKSGYPEGLDETSIGIILKECLEGLDYLHKQGHIHRDIKAGNLLVDENASVFLADFGVSSSLMEHGERKGRRRTFVGTPCWMAPEVLTPENGYDYKADIWSFGITAIELATGQAPYAKFPPLKVLMMTLKKDPPTLNRSKTKNKFSKSFANMIDLCLQKDPKKRPTAEELLKHSFFKTTRRKEHLLKILQDLPPLEASPRENDDMESLTSRAIQSWDFDDEDEDSASITSSTGTEILLASGDNGESTEMYNTIERDTKSALPAIEETSEDGKASTVSDAETVRKGRFNVSIHRGSAASIQTAYEKCDGGQPELSERKGRFSVTPMTSLEEMSLSSDQQRASNGNTPGVTSNNNGFTSEQLQKVVDKSVKLRTVIASGQVDRSSMDEIVNCLVKMEAIINRSLIDKN